MSALLKSVAIILLAASVLPACKKCKAIGSSIAPEVAIVDNNPGSPRYNQNVGVLYFDVQQNENDGGECDKWAGLVSFVIHNNTNQTMQISYTVNFVGTTNWFKSDSVSIPAFSGINKDAFSNVGADYAHGTFTVNANSITYQ